MSVSGSTLARITETLRSTKTAQLSAAVSATNGISFFSFVRLYEKLSQSAYHGIIQIPKSSESINVYFQSEDIWAKYQDHNSKLVTVTQLNNLSVDNIGVRGVPVNLVVRTELPVVARLQGKIPSYYRFTCSWSFLVKDECEYILRKVMHGKSKHEARHQNPVKYELELLHLGGHDQLPGFLDHVLDLVGRFEKPVHPPLAPAVQSVTGGV
jgi:hypothetical protein